MVPPDPAIPLSQLGLSPGLEFEPGTTAVTFEIPIRADARAEPFEGVVLLLDAAGDPVVPQPIEATGAVPAN
jgi:hypothetical protein